MAANLSQISSIKVKARNEFRYPNKEESREISEIRSKVVVCRYLPNDLLAAVQVAYSKKCIKCNLLCTFGHISRDHKLTKFTLPQLLDRLQSPKSRRSAKSDIKYISRLIT